MEPALKGIGWGEGKGKGMKRGGKGRNPREPGGAQREGNEFKGMGRNPRGKGIKEPKGEGTERRPRQGMGCKLCLMKKSEIIYFHFLKI